LLINGALNVAPAEEKGDREPQPSCVCSEGSPLDGTDRGWRRPVMSKQEGKEPADITVRDITAEANVQLGLINYHFPNH